MKNKFITIMIILVMALSLTACGDSVSVVENADMGTETTVMFERHEMSGSNNYSILVDKQTGVCYLEYKHRAGKGYYGITVMLNADGTPKIWEEE